MKKLLLIFLLIIVNIELRAPVYPVFDIPVSEPVVIAGELNWYNIDKELREHDIQHIDKVKRQIKLETGDLTSRFCRECNNLFGMKYPRKRQTKAIGIDNSMSVYRTWQDSIEDYAIWQREFYKGGDYYGFLNGRYAADKNYIKKLKKL